LQPDVPWLVAEEAPEQPWTAVAAETHQPDFKEEHQMEHSWTTDDSGESDEPSAWSEPSDDAGSGHGYASEFAGLAQTGQEHEQERWDADQAPVVAHLAPVV